MPGKEYFAGLGMKRPSMIVGRFWTALATWTCRLTAEMVPGLEVPFKPLRALSNPWGQALPDCSRVVDLCLRMIGQGELRTTDGAAGKHSPPNGT